MMDNEADMVILFVSHENELFTLLKFGRILIYQNQQLQILIFMVYKAPYVQLIKTNIIVLWWTFVMKPHDNPFNPGSYFVSSFTLLYFLSHVVIQIR